MYIQGGGNLYSTWSCVISFCFAAHEAVKFALNYVFSFWFFDGNLLPAPPPPRQFVREMPLLVVLISLLMKLQFINQKKKVDVQPYCIKALFVLKLLFFCSNFMLPIYRAFVQIVCVCARVGFPYTRALIQIVCVYVGVYVLPIHRGFHLDCVCV